MTLLNHLVRTIRAAARFNPDAKVAPSCILWPDSEGQWLPAIPLLLAQMPELYVLGEYDPQKRQGPAIWLRCVLAGRIAALPGRGGLPPVFYLPNVRRRDLRVEACPAALKPLAWLQYRGVIFSHINARDWTVPALLKSVPDNLELDVSRDAETREAMLAALPRLLMEDAAIFGGKRLDAAFFNTLLAGGDSIREILQWLNDETTFRAGRSDAEWQAFCRICKADFGLDPQSEGVLTACALLAGREGAWKNVWRRYEEAWRSYPQIYNNIKKCLPPKDNLNWLLADAANAGWPQWNEEQENSLAAELPKLANLPPEQIKTRILELDRQHGPRRALVWAEMGQAPLAQALEHLATIARDSQNALASGSYETLAEAYNQTGWHVDNAAIQALNLAQSKNDAITIALDGIYKPWLEESSLYLQKLAADTTYPDCPPLDLAEGECVLFVDGLRFDLAKGLAAILRADGFEVAERIAWSALPTVTPTGKPAVSPCRDLISGFEDNADFEPCVTATCKPLKGHFSSLLEQCGVQVLKWGSCCNALGKAWTEFGKIDHMGHGDGAMLAVSLAGLLRQIAAGARELLATGWKRLHIVTDHGWLLLPGGLPKYNLEASLAENKWGRCACIKAGAATELYQYPWFWNKNCYFAFAPGISCFKNGQAFSHGGISLQECLTLRLTVEQNTETDVKVEDATWRGLRCKITVSGGSAGHMADIRHKPADAAASLLAAPRPIKPDGSLSLLVENEDMEGDRAFLVILDQNGSLLTQYETVIGG